MKTLATVTIAGVALAMRGDSTIVIREKAAAMQPFFHSGPRESEPGAEVIDIVLHQATEPPAMAGLVKSFDSGDAWSLWTSDTRAVLRLQPPGADMALWHLDMDAAFTRGALYCHGDYWLNGTSQPTVSNPLRYPLDQILVMLHLATHFGVVLHAAAAVIRGRGFIFLGRSGAGKSTLSTLLAADCRVTLLSDDRIIVRRVRGQWMAYGTPWPGDAGIARNHGVPLAGGCLLSKADPCTVTPLTPKNALTRLLPVTSIPLFDRKRSDAVLSSCESLTAEVPMFELQFSPRPEAVSQIIHLAGS